MSLDNHQMICGKRGKHLSQPINSPFTALHYCLYLVSLTIQSYIVLYLLIIDIFLPTKDKLVVWTV